MERYRLFRLIRGVWQVYDWKGGSIGGVSQFVQEKADTEHHQQVFNCFLITNRRDFATLQYRPFRVGAGFFSTLPTMGIIKNYLVTAVHGNFKIKSQELFARTASLFLMSWNWGRSIFFHSSLCPDCHLLDSGVGKISSC